MLFRVDDLAHEREILREPQDVRGVDDRIGAEPGDAFEDGRARQPSRAEKLEQRRMERAVAGSIRLSDEDAHQDLLAVNFPHDYTRTPTISRPAAMPRKHTPRQSDVVTRTLTHA